jgi:hypothetical protein
MAVHVVYVGKDKEKETSHIAKRQTMKMSQPPRSFSQAVFRFTTSSIPVEESALRIIDVHPATKTHAL